MHALYKWCTLPQVVSVKDHLLLRQLHQTMTVMGEPMTQESFL